MSRRSLKVAKLGFISRLRAINPNSGTVVLADKAARTVAEWDNSNPFAYNQAMRDMERQFVSPSDLLETYEGKLATRKKELEESGRKASAFVQGLLGLNG